MSSNAAPQALSKRTVPDIDRAFGKAVSEKTIGAGACVGSVQAGIFERGVYGNLTPPPPLRRLDHQAVFDLGSLTAPLGSGLAALHLVSRHRLDLGVSVASVLKDFAGPPYTQITLDMLLDHSSGLPAEAPLFDTLYKEDRVRHPDEQLLGSRKSEPAMREALRAVKLAADPGKATCVSGLNSMLLGWVIEAVCGKPLDTFLEQEIYGPLGLAEELFFVRVRDDRPPKLNLRRMFVATASCKTRNKLMHGEVWDKEAWGLGGVAGHAGLFGSAQAVWRLAQRLLECYRGQHPFFHSGTLARFWTRSRRMETTRTLGWDTPTVLGSTAGKRMPRTAVGTVSRTGCALWIDHSQETVGVLLTNGLQSKADSPKDPLYKMRVRIFELIAANAGLGPPPPDADEAWERLVRG